ncbi:MAG: hypothetical protein WD267_05050 [Balneolales bacterium]
MGIADMLQVYGVVIADVSGWGDSVKMEHTYENWPNSYPNDIAQRAFQKSTY